MSSLIFGLEHSLKTRPLNVGARRASSICYQCNEGPFSWNQCDLMSLKPFTILLLMLNIAHLLLQKENQKEDRAVRIPLLDDILCDILIWKGSVPMHWQRWHLYSVLTSLMWLDKMELRIWGEHIWEQRDWRWQENGNWKTKEHAKYI